MKRVVITGMDVITPIGSGWDEVFANLKAGQSGIRTMPEWSDIQGLGSYLAAPSDPEVGIGLPVKQARSMSRVSLIAAETAVQALKMSGLSDYPGFDPSDTGVAYGSSFGGHEKMVPFSQVLSDKRVRGISPTGYIQLMGHTAGVNLSLLLGLQGRLIPASAACASGGLAIGYGMETIRQSVHPVMVAGSAEELAPMQVAVFDSFYAASREHDNPAQSARPFAHDRGGMVVGDGGATLILESLSHACNRNAHILAEVVGFATIMDGSHVVRQDVDMMCRVMTKALESAGLAPEQIGYINAHASGAASDAGEADAIVRVFGGRVPVSSLKGHLGHLLGGCGAVEAALSISMMNKGWFAPSLNLHTPGDDCQGIAHIGPEGLTADVDYVMSNNFAFGGVNVSVIFKRWRG